MSEEDWLSGLQPEQPLVPAEGLRRHLGLAVRGATLGMAGPARGPETIGESATEMLSSVPTVVGISALTSPLGGAVARATPLLRAPSVLPTASRMIGAAGTGLAVGGVQSAAEGKPVLFGALTEAAKWTALEGGFIGATRLLRGTPRVLASGQTTIPSAVEQPVEREIARGQGISPDYPPQLALPVKGSETVFDSKDYLGSGTVLSPERNPQLRQGRVLRPEEVTRSMLPAGTPPKTLPAHPEGGPGRQFGEGPWDPYFSHELDPTMGPVLVPKTPEVEEGLQTALGIHPKMMGELPLTEAQIHHMEVVKPELKRKLDTVTKRQQFESSELVKKSPAEVEAATLTGQTPPIEFHGIELSPSGLEARSLITKAGIEENEYIKFGSTLTGSRATREAALLAWLKERCR